MRGNRNLRDTHRGPSKSKREGMKTGRGRVAWKGSRESRQKRLGRRKKPDPKEHDEVDVERRPSA